MIVYTFPQLIKKIRNEAGLTQAEFAKEVGVSKALIAMVESGQKEVSKKLVEKVADRLNVSPMSITPFLFYDKAIDFNDLPSVEKSFIKYGTKLQEYLIRDRSKLLRGHGESKKLSQDPY